MKFYTASMDAANNLMSIRQQLKTLKDREKQLRDEFAETILLDAVEQPSRVLRIDTYWRVTGLRPMDVEQMVARLANDPSSNPLFQNLKTTRIGITRRFAEFSEDGAPTGGFIEKTEECPVIINLGEVRPPRSGEASEPAVLGSASLLNDGALCRSNCRYLQRGMECPYESDPIPKWKCAYNWEGVQEIINAILAEIEKKNA